MFEYPRNPHTKVLGNERKIRYQYINELYKNYNSNSKLRNNLSLSNSDNGLPTPESSAHEHSENESNNNNNDFDFDEISNHNSSNEESKYFSRHDKPEDGYEIWENNINKKIPINKTHITFKKYSKIEKLSNKKIQNRIIHTSNRLQNHFNAIKQGYETNYFEIQTNSYKNIHFENLINLLHYSISRENWIQGQRIFAILIRIPFVDIRDIWGPGSLILRHSISLSSSVEFLHLMTQIYASRQRFHHNVNYQFPPVFSRSSRTHMSKFTSSWLWLHLKYLQKIPYEDGINNFDRQRRKIDDFIDKLDSMILIPPYSEDSEVWYILGMAHYLMSKNLSEQWKINNNKLKGSDKDIAIGKISSHIQKVENYLNTAKSKSECRFDGDIIINKLKDMERELYEKGNSSSSSNEEEEEEENNSSDMDDTYIIPEYHSDSST